MLYMPAVRTQVYLSSDQRRKLDARRRRERKTLAAVIRDAIDAYVGTDRTRDVEKVLDETFGVNPNFTVPSRDEWEERARRLGI